jgi:hypothetical protein
VSDPIDLERIKAVVEDAQTERDMLQAYARDVERERDELAAHVAKLREALEKVVTDWANSCDDMSREEYELFDIARRALTEKEET